MLAKIAKSCPRSETCVHGIGFTSSPDTVAYENLASEKEVDPSSDRWEDPKEDIEDNRAQARR